MEIREYRTEDRDGVLALLARHFGMWSARRALQRWSWQYNADRGCDGQMHYVQVVEADGEIVGHLGAFPLPVRASGQRCSVLSPGGLVVDPAHGLAAFGLIENLLEQRNLILGIGWSRAAAKLFKFNGAESLPSSDVRHVYPLKYVGVTQRELRRRLPRTIRWLGMRCVAAAAAPLLDRRRDRDKKPLPRQERGFDIRPIVRFDQSYAALWQEAAAQFDTSVDKSTVYMNWRYVDCPTTRHWCLGLFDGEKLKAMVVACRRTHADVSGGRCGADGEIVELMTTSWSLPGLRPLVVAMMAKLAALRVDKISAIGFHAPAHQLLASIGFDQEPCTWATLFGISKDPSLPLGTWLTDESSYFTCGDGDHLFMPAV